MSQIQFRFPIQGSASDIFSAFAHPKGLDSWWTLKSEGVPEEGATYRFYFSDEFDWKGVVSAIEADRLIEWTFTDAEPDWTGTKLRLELAENNGVIWVDFNHYDWDQADDHRLKSSYCWAMYLRHLKRFVEDGIVVAYEARDND